MSNHRLKENPFYKLQATPRDSDRRLVSRATDIKLLTGEDMHEAREILLKPQGRLEAEIAFLPGIDEEEIVKLRGMIEKNAEQMTLPDLEDALKPKVPAGDGKDGPETFRADSALALLNGAAAILESWTFNDAESAAAAALSMAGMIRRINPEHVILQINRDRKAGGRELLESEGEVGYRLKGHIRALLGMLCDRIMALPETEAYKAQEMIADAYCDQGEQYAHLPALDELISVHFAHRNAAAAATAKGRILEMMKAYDAYVMQNPVRFVSNGSGDAAKVKEQDEARRAITEELIFQLRAWNHVTAQQRRITRTKGYTQEESHSLFVDVLHFFADMFNKRHDRVNAREVIKAMQDVFWDQSQENRDLMQRNARITGAL